MHFPRSKRHPDQSMTDHTNRLARFVNQIARTRDLGGRCSAIDDTRCVLYDCGNWTNAMHNAVVKQYHNCNITVTPFESSVSGFIVIFDLYRPKHPMAMTFMLVTMLAVFAVVTYYFSRGVVPDLRAWPEFMNVSSA